MGDSGREFKILITGDAGGLQEASKQGANALNDELNPAVESFQKTWKHADNAVSETVKKGELKHMVRELKRDFPELGMIARIAINPIVGGFTALLGVMKVVDSVFKSILTNSNTGIFSGSFVRNMEAARTAAVESEIAWRSFARTMEAAATGAESLKTQTEQATTAIRQHGVAVAEQQNAGKALELAKINAMEAGGKLTGPQAIQARLGIEDKYGRRKLVSDIETKDAEIEAKRQEVDKLNKGADHAEVQAQQYRQEYEDAQRDLERFKALKAGTEKALVETTKQVDAIKGGARLTAITEAAERIIDPSAGPSPSITQLKSARALQEQLKARLVSMQENEIDYADPAKAAQERYNNAMKRAQEMRSSAAEIGAKIPGEQALANQGYRDAGQVAAIERGTRTYSAITDVAHQQSQVKGEIDSAVAGFRGVAVSSYEKLKELNDALKDLQKQVNGLQAGRDNRHL